MRTGWVGVSLALLAPAIVGCRVLPPARSVSSPGWREASDVARDWPVESLPTPRPIVDDETVLTLHHEFEPLASPTVLSVQQTLTLADLEEIALEHNPTLVTAEARVDAARGQWEQAGLYPNPVIGYHATEVGNLETAGQQGGFISQRFITAGKLRLDQAVASRKIQEASFLFDVQQQRVLSDVQVRFYDALVAGRRLELTKQLARIGDELVAASEKLLKARQISENNLLQSEIEAEESHVLDDNARNENVEAWRRLAAVIGVPMMKVTPLQDDLDQDLPRYTWEDCYTMVVKQSPELAAARARVERARASIQRAGREKIPDIDLSVSVRHHNVTGSDVANVQVGIPIPIFDANQGNVQTAQAEWIAARNDARRIELDLQDRLAVAFRRYANAHQQADRYNSRIQTRARRSLDLVTDGYQKGQVDYLMLITTQQTFVRVNLAYLDAVREFREAMAVIEGQLLSDSLSQR